MHHCWRGDDVFGRSQRHRVATAKDAKDILTRRAPGSAVFSQLGAALRLNSRTGMTELKRRPLQRQIREVGKATVFVAVAWSACMVPLVVCHSRGDCSRADTARLDLQNILAALKLHRAKSGAIPDSSQGLRALVPAGFLEKVPVDPWGREYRYSVRNGLLELASFGADGLPCGEGAESDIVLRVTVPELVPVP